MFANSLGGIFMAGVRVTICGVNTKDLPLLSAKDKKELLTKIKATTTHVKLSSKVISGLS